MIKTGLFCGSFNPIHVGHLALANYLCEFEGLEEVWFVVSPHNPLKQESDLLEDTKRMELVKLSISGYKKFKASDFEFNMPKPSYTVYTIEALKKEFPEREFFLIIGADNWLVFDKWKDYQRIISENKILIYPRPGADIDEQLLPESVRLTHAPVLEISSTFIREAIAEGKDMRYFLQPDAYSKIMTEKLY